MQDNKLNYVTSLTYKKYSLELFLNYILLMNLVLI